MEIQDKVPTFAPASEFPVPWSDGLDSRLCWRHDRVHSPHPIFPLTGEVGGRAMEGGFNRAAEHFGLPLRVRFRRINTFSYQAVVPVADGVEDLATGHREAEQGLRQALVTLRRTWDEEWLPEIREHLAWWDAFDLREASHRRLAAHMQESVERLERLWEIHFRVGIPFLLGPSLFDEMYRELFPDRPPLEAYVLIEGFDNRTFQSERALWKLSRQALASPQVAGALRDSQGPGIPQGLEELAGGPAFLQGLEGYLEEFGERSSEFFELANRSWLEDPSPVIYSLRNYLDQPERDLDTELSTAARERERGVARARAALEDFPAPVVQEFELLLRVAQDASFLHSEHAYWIDQKGTYRMRQVLLEAGRRLVEDGHVERAEDVFCLELEEIRGALEHDVDDDLGSRARRRREEVERFQVGSPPPVVGTVPKGEPPDSPLHRAIGKFVGAPPQPAEQSDLLVGHPASAGVVEGRVRVLGSLQDSARLRPGDVLVARTTAPPWTPLFSTASAVVTDAGGVLSHCAVVAREYRIPAVVGTGHATLKLRDGDLVRVDGAAGRVRVLRRNSEPMEGADAAQG